MAEKRIQTSAGMETVSETVTRAKAQLERAKQNGSAPSAPESKPNPLIEALTERLTKQGKGISTSSTSSLQDSINEAISSTQQAGDLTTQRLQSERGREVAYAQDRAGATITGALEERTGYATQVAALRELTETTEKSIRDLDKRYQEAILANDSETARTIAGLKVQKLQFQVEQEQNFFQNLLGVGNLSEQQQAREQANQRFYVETQQKERQFMQEMEQSKYQFEKNLGVQYRQLELSEQELEIQRERNAITRQEYADRRAELAAEKKKSAIAGQVFRDMRNEVVGLGKSVDELDPSAYALYLAESNPNIEFEEALFYAQAAKSEFATQGLTPPVAQNQSSFMSDFSQFSGSGLGRVGGAALDAASALPGPVGSLFGIANLFNR